MPVKNTSVEFLWRDRDRVTQFNAGVCLHGHTMHSEECLWFLPRYLNLIPGVSRIASFYQRGPRPAVDFARAYWTPPLSPASALRLEREQIAKMGLRPMVSLTDHDNIEAGMALQVATDPKTTPVSVEWTVPYHRSILHLGIHNLPPLSARSWMSEMGSYTSAPDKRRLPDMLSELAKIPDVLIVLNHPFWLEEQVEESDHRIALDHALSECIDWFHAFELNGTRKWKENAAVVELAQTYSRPVISGGDRHAGEPSACLNLTNARSFSGFVSEIRDGYSSVVFTPQYREPMGLRLAEACWDVLRPYHEYPGRERWTDRFFYRGEDGVAEPLSKLWKDRVPLVLQPATSALQFFTTSAMRQALRSFLSRRLESLP